MRTFLEYISTYNLISYAMKTLTYIFIIVITVLINFVRRVWFNVNAALRNTMFTYFYIGEYYGFIALFSVSLTCGK